MSPSQNDFGSREGFTMIELMIAMAIMAISMLAVVSLQISTSRNNTKGNVYTQANMLAMSQLEVLKNSDISLLIPGTYADGTTLDENGESGGIYTRSWTITDTGAGARALSVVVQWNRAGGPGRVEVASNARGAGI